MKNKLIKLFISATLAIGIITGGIVTANNLVHSKAKEKATFALVNENLTDEEVINYQTQVPDWVNTVQINVNGNAATTYSIAELIANNYQTFDLFKDQFFKSGRLNFKKTNCEAAIKNAYRSTNNCAFLTSLLYMEEVNNIIEGEDGEDLFITANNNNTQWVINPEFFKEDNNETDADDNYLVLNYLAHNERFGFEKEEITAAPFQLAFLMGAKGAAIRNFSLSRFPSASPTSSQAIFNFEGNPIVHYPTQAFTTERIESVNLKRTNLGALASTAWPMIFSNVIDLNLQDNSLQNIPVGFLPTLTSLKNLRLSSSNADVDEKNELTTLPTDFRQLAPHLELLDLGFNNFVTNPILPYIQDLNALQILELQGNTITQVGDLGQLGNTLLSLSLKNTNISSLGTILNNLTKLQTLILSENSLTTLPATFFDNYDDLVYLDLNKNQLTSLPSLNNLTKLKTLLVADNENLELNADSLARLTELNVLNLNYTKIDVSSLDISNLPLYQVSFNKLNLTEVPENILSITSLQLVSLSENQISEAKIAPYWRRVSFYNNPIKTISAYAMPAMTSLIKPNKGFTFLNWTEHLEAIILDYANLDWSLMNDPRILKVRIPLFWDLARITNFYSTAASTGMVNKPINEILHSDIKREEIPDILPTTLEFELLKPTVESELKKLNDNYNHDYNYNDINNEKLAYSFAKSYQGPEDFNSIGAYTTALQASVKIAYNNYDLLVENNKLRTAVNDKNAERNAALVSDRNVTILIVVAIILTFLFTIIALLIIANRKKRKAEN